MSISQDAVDNLQPSASSPPSSPQAQTDTPNEELAEGAVISTKKREKFIPVTRFAILDRLAKDDVWEENERNSAQVFLRYLAAWRHQDYNSRLLQLKEAYLPFSPDRDTIRILTYSDAKMLGMREELINQLSKLLIQANYEEVTQDDIDHFFENDSPYGLNLKVDLSEFDNVLVFARGSDVITKKERTWKKLFIGKETIEVPIFQRLFLLLKMKPEAARIPEIMKSEELSEKAARRRLKKYRKHLPLDVSADHVYLKLFKNIPQTDLEMLFPNTKVEFKLLDKLKFGVTAGGGTLVSVVGTATKVLAATNPITLAGALIGLVAVIFRQVMSFFNQRTRYMMVLAQNLYFHNLANNRGVLTLLVDRAEEEDIKEEMLLYSYLTQYEVPRDQLEEARLAIESYLESEFGIQIHFDIHDALGRLRKDGLIIENEHGVISAMRPQHACVHLEKMWKESLAKQHA